MIGNVWFNFIDQLSEEEQTQLKKDLDGKTLIGEYVGNQEFQHIIAYENELIIFYTIVKNSVSKTSCQLPEQCAKLFKKYGLIAVNTQSRGRFSDFGKLKSKLLEIYSEVGSGPIQTQEEGCVIYLVARTEGKSQDEVISLSKMKTMEYRIFRKLREKLKIFNAKHAIGKGDEKLISIV